MQQSHAAVLCTQRRGSKSIERRLFKEVTSKRYFIVYVYLSPHYLEYLRSKMRAVNVVSALSSGDNTPVFCICCLYCDM